MKNLMKNLSKALLLLLIGTAFADNQTATLSPVSSQSSLPFSISIQQANFQLPVGIHSGVVGFYKGYWIFIAGRINGLHGFNASGNFPSDQQNTTIYVVNPVTGVTTSRALTDPSSGLTQAQIDSLSVTSPEGYQDSTTLYLVGGYGYDTTSSTYSTKSTLTAINLPGIVQWVMNPGNPNFSVAQNSKQLSNPVFQVTGGRLFKSGNMFQLVFGQNFIGSYTTSSNGIYSDQVRQFQLINNNGQFSVNVYPAFPSVRDDIDFRRRDLNVMPTLLKRGNLLQYGLIAYAGVFTPTGGVWTVPVVIDGSGTAMMADPNASTTFKQAMNHYACASVGLYSRKLTNMYHIFFGGLSYGFFSGGTFQTDAEVPFTNQVTTIQMDQNGNFSQYLMDNQYPTIISTQSNPGNTLLFGAGAYFIPNNFIPSYGNGVLNLDGIRQSVVIGYIVGGIQSTLANTNVMSDSAASPYVFSVTLTPT